MPSAETLIYSDAQRAGMLARMQDIAQKGEISAEQLEELAWLVLKRDLHKDGLNYEEDEYHGELNLPNSKNPKISIIEATKNAFFHLALLDNVEPGSEDQGEQVTMDRDERGSLRWRVGNFNSMYSQLLGRRMLLEDPFDVVAQDSLTPVEHAEVARRLVSAYQEMLAEHPNLA